MYSQERAVFSFSTRIKKGSYVNEFDNPLRIRYTINSLVGLQQAVGYYDLGWEVPTLIERFIDLHWQNVVNEGDHGLFLYLLASASHDASHRQFARVKAIVDDQNRLMKLNIQDLSWILMGLTKYTRTSQQDVVANTAEGLFGIIHRHFFNRDSLLPYHDRSLARGFFVSFGYITYFLKAIHEYASVFDDRYVRSIFLEAAKILISLQGEDGSWPWFIYVPSGRIMDWYQVYSVHQDAMTMLFLLPAIDFGVSEAEKAVCKSYKWLFGVNVLATPMLSLEPFFIYRSIRRRVSNERARRYAESLVNLLTGRSATLDTSSVLTVNHECRSYHLGWILYVWAGRQDFSEFTGLTVRPDLLRT
jgi:hypothetical protein